MHALIPGTKKFDILFTFKLAKERYESLDINPLQPKRTLHSSIEYALFYKFLCFVQGTRGFGHVQLMNKTYLEII